MSASHNLEPRFPMPYIEDLDKAVATEIMGFELDPLHSQIVTRLEDGASLLWPGLLPRYATDPIATMAMEQQMERLGLAEDYVIALARRVRYDRTPLGAWRLLRASCRVRCEVALEVARAHGGILGPPKLSYEPYTP